MNTRLALFALALGLSPIACASATPAPLAPDVQALWDRCTSAVERYCHEHSHGSPSHERQCVRDERDNLARAPDDAARRSSLHGFGCPL
jgi:predicted secreted Zn-dependent protease